MTIILRVACDFVTETCLDCAANFIEIIGRPTVEG